MSIVKLNNRGVKNATAFGSITGLGNLIFISRSTASSSSSVSITSGIDSTYKEYIFVFNNIHASTQAHFQVNFSADGGSNYNVTKTTSFFFSSHNEAGDSVSFSYQGSYDLAQSTSAQPLGLSFSSDSDAGGAGYMHLFDPSNTTFAKHYLARCNNYIGVNYSFDSHMGGYGNTTSAVNAIDFRYSAGNIVSGTIDLYGVK